MNMKEFEPTTKSINESIFEEDLGIVIDEFVKLDFKEVNKGKEVNMRKQFFFDYFNDLKIKIQEIYSWLLNNQDDPNSAYLLGGINLLGCCYDSGIGTDIDKEKAFELYQKAANLGNSHGISNLGWYYEKGFIACIDKKKAFELYQRAADLGNSHGIRNLGRCYEKGIGIDVNKQEAFELYQKAANLGNRFAQYNLALMYEKGDVIEIDINQAIYWYKKSAEQGYQYAQNKLKSILNG
ncbi:kinase-like domain-containing protein [Rhizophagus clarus]|uniref:Kinase-like domain-containing protein n=1 Tax=Rhizophagus clarus TaxID=94130 RepID=A0A8H3LQW9_9GLOM|nr:kinase-like domain-containing protein [Rhizophagus clarus]